MLSFEMKTGAAEKSTGIAKPRNIDDKNRHLSKTEVWQVIHIIPGVLAIGSLYLVKLIQLLLQSSLYCLKISSKLLIHRSGIFDTLLTC
jgi:hypothetical protein